MRFCLRISIILFTLLMAFSDHQVFGQEKFFSPETEESNFSSTVLTSLENNYTQNKAKLSGQNKKDLEKVYTDRWKNIQEKFTNKDIYFEKEARKYLESLVNEIVKANPALQNQSFQCYFSKSGIPNAEYLGEGLILLNMGLFSRLQNESQTAFILCHELAHYYLQHSEKSIESYVMTLNSKEVQNELKNIKKAEYGKRAVLEKLLKGLTFDSRRHGRLHESEADSMAVEFMKNTRFEMGEALKTLDLLDAIDADTMMIAGTLERMFDFEGFPFKKKWIAKEEGLLGGHALLQKDETLADSLKTHPDCQKRIQILEPLIQKYTGANKVLNPVSAKKFEELGHRFKYEIADHSFASENYTKSLYYTIELEEYPADPYLITQIGKMFNGLYNAQVKHTLSKVIELPAPYFEPNYNLLLQFIQNLYKEDFAAISYHFLNQFAAQMQNYPVFKNTYQTSISNFK